MTEPPKTPTPWWGDHALEEGQTARWRIGALTLWAHRRAQEWRLAHATTNDPFDNEVAVEVPCGEPLPTQGVSIVRFGMGRTEPALRVLPVLPDRPVGSRPDPPFSVLAGEEGRLSMSSPVWVRVLAGARRLLDLPVYRPSDTWFGASTREGEVCYASWTTCRTDLADLPVRPHRAVAPVRIRNRTQEPVLVERLNMPVLYLSLYASTDGVLWTQGVTLDLAVEGGTAEIQIDKEGPRESPGAVRLADPRDDAGKNLLVRALSALIG